MLSKIEEAIEVLTYEERFENIDCSCHIAPPCAKCVEKPDEETITEANFAALAALKTMREMEKEPHKSEYTAHWLEVFNEFQKSS